MKRKIYNELLKWKNDWNGTTALLIDGARRVGKSWIAEEFGKNEYKSYILVDFGNLNPELKEIFNLYLNSLDEFFFRLSLSTGVKLYERESLIIFDEIQQFPKARAAIKYLVKDGRYDYLETGSLISINKNVKDIIIPSEEVRIKMYPMDFEEFMWALDQKDLYDFALDRFTSESPVGSFHRKLMDNVRLYLITGGMPQAINKYIETKDFIMVDSIKRNILNLYRNDIERYSDKSSNKILKIFDNIPSMLQKHERKFRPSEIKKGSKSRDYGESLYWLQESMTTNFCFAVSEPEINFSFVKLENRLKIYLGDTGLLLSMAFEKQEMQKLELYRKILLNKLEFNKGMIIENFIAQQLVANGHQLYYYSCNSRENKEDRMEIDFLTIKKELTNRHNINVIEVKSSSRYTFTSLLKFSKKFSSHINRKILFHTGDLKIENDILFLPLYMASMI